MNDPFAMPDLALEDRVQALEMNLIDILRRIKLLEEQAVRTARSGDADTGRAGGAVIDTPRESTQRFHIGPEGIPGWIAPFETPTPSSARPLLNDSVVVTGPCPRPPTRVVHTGGVSVWVYFDLFCFYGGGDGGYWVAHKRPTQMERALFDALVPAWQSVGVEFYSSDPITDMHGFPAPPPWTATIETKALTEQDAAAIVAAATTGIATAGSQDDNRVTRDPVSDVITGEVADAYAEHYRRSRGMMPGRSERRPNGEIVEVYVPDGSSFGSRCPGEKCGGRGRIHDAERRCAECGGR